MKRYIVGPLHLEIEQRVLYLGTEVVPLSPKSFDILLVLVENAGQVISRDAIREQVWGDAFIEDANLSNNISMLRAALRPHLGDAQPIKTFSKRGYQFTIPVELATERKREPASVQPAPPLSMPSPAPGSSWPGYQWKTRGNVILLASLAVGLLITLALIRSALAGTLPRHRPASALLTGLDRATALLTSAHPFPSLAVTLLIAGVLGVVAVVGRRRPGLHTGNWLLALTFLAGSQIVGTISHETSMRNTIGMLGQVLIGLTLAAYKPEKTRLSRSWLFYLDLLPLLVFVICCGHDVKKAGIYVGLSAVGRVMLLGTYLLRRDALLPVVVSVAGWISMALLAASGQYLGAAFTAIAIVSLYAAVNLSVRLPCENIGKPILVLGMLLWALYAATYPAAYPHAALHALWSLLLLVAKLLVCIGMTVFVLRAQPEQRHETLLEALASAA